MLPDIASKGFFVRYNNLGFFVPLHKLYLILKCNVEKKKPYTVFKFTITRGSWRRLHKKRHE